MAENQIKNIELAAEHCWNEGGRSTDCPYTYSSLEWCVWMRSYAQCSDKYMDLLVEDQH